MEEVYNCIDNDVCNNIFRASHFICKKAEELNDEAINLNDKDILNKVHEHDIVNTVDNCPENDLIGVTFLPSLAFFVKMLIFISTFYVCQR